MSIILALDAMGGDHAPDIVVEGASLALQQCPGISYNMYGDEKKLVPLVAKFSNLSSCVQIHHTDEAVTYDTPLSQAIRGLRHSSMRLAIDSVARGESDAVISAGNTGPYMALSKMRLKTLEGVDRPAIATTIPTQKGPGCVVLDLGANVDCTVENLVQFAVMGDVVANRILHKTNPTIGLLNVGTEEMKGSAVVQQAAQMIREMTNLNYIGFVEGDDITSGDIDVIVTDGFSGNIALKSMEGIAKFITSTIRGEMASSWRGKLGYLIARPTFEAIKKRMDPRLHNGAVFIGLRGVAVKSHGSADAIAFANAIRVTSELTHKIDSENIDAESQSLGQEIEEKLRNSSGISSDFI